MVRIQKKKDSGADIGERELRNQATCINGKKKITKKRYEEIKGEKRV